MFDKLKLANKKVRIIKLPQELGVGYPPHDQEVELDVIIDTIYDVEALGASVKNFQGLNQPKAILYLIYPKLASKKYEKKCIVMR